MTTNSTNIPRWIKTNNTLVLNYPGKNYTIKSNNPIFNKAIDYLKTENWDKLIELLTPAHTFIKYSGGELVIKDNNLYIKGDNEPINIVIANKIKQFSEEGLPFTPLINFWNKLKENPSKKSIEQLYSFLERNHLPITQDGDLIAFKGVYKSDAVKNESYYGEIKKAHGNNLYFSVHCDKDGRHVPNIIGQSVYMNREEIDDDANSHCSVGLHVGAFSYANTFGYGSRETLECLINPAHVVSVPNDCGCQKMRVCEYKVLGIVREEKINDLVINDYSQNDTEDIEDESGAYSKADITAEDKEWADSNNEVYDYDGKDYNTKVLAESYYDDSITEIELDNEQYHFTFDKKKTAREIIEEVKLALSINLSAEDKKILNNYLDNPNKIRRNRVIPKLIKMLHKYNYAVIQ